MAVSAAKRVRVDGLVQGVGFRPFIHRLALRHELAGWVLNTSGSVDMHLEGASAALDRFLIDLRESAPVLSRIETLVALDVAPEGLTSFEVRVSASSANTRLPVSPDVAMCASCVRELLDPRNRRFRYPFITCTDCGPRFTVIESMPYDRERTTMRAFTQCRSCLREYNTPGDRRYHSETNSCPECGPSLWLERSGARDHVANGDYALTTAAEFFWHGGIVAVRGLGGFQLAVNATDQAAVARLRERKHREAKPLAVMVETLDDARRIAEVTPHEAELLVSAAAPIVTCRLRATGRDLAPNVTPGLAHVGIMLAYTPLHLLLLRAANVPLVMTSGNRSEEPIATSIEEARERLGSIADAFLFHDREIVARYDDSVVRVVDDAPVFLRRARGYAPLPIDLPVESPRPLLAVGPHLKNTFTLLHGRRAWVSQHIGDLENIETLEHFRAARSRFEFLFHIRPEAVVHDRHPGYLSTRLALASELDTIIAVQHHHAHIAAVMAEHGRTDPVIGVAYDGTGYGDDGHVWGSEILYADLAGYQRLGHLRYAPLPGGDAAARAPWRVALGYFSLGAGGPHEALPAMRDVDGLERALAERQLERGLNSPLASSMGRLFDAAAAILGVRYRSRYEGQAAMELEARAADHQGRILPYCLTSEATGWVFDPLPLLSALATRAAIGENSGVLAASFHETVVAATAELVRKIADASGCRTVALGGGCFQNARLLTSMRHALHHDGFEVLVPRQLGPNDGAISVGQAAIAAALLSGQSSTARLSRGVNVTLGG
ncbi:MAG TPA: carbamoyltransferase HypF [Gemmatimonadaceae bacterium]|nr:carbamoyltransferase HypF [Gemmatimonadaceae bacterium]